MQQHAREWADRPALVDGPRRIGWAELADHVARAATGLSDLVAGPARAAEPARAVFLAENRWEVVATQAAAATIGLPLVGVDHTLAAPEVAACLRQARPAVVFVSAGRAALLAEALVLLAATGGPPVTPAVVGYDPGTAPGLPAGTGWADLATTRPGPRRWLAQPYEGLSFTAGSSGVPRLVRRRVPYEPRLFQDLTELLGITPDDVYLDTAPLSHAPGRDWARVFATHGGTVVLAARDDPAALLAALDGERVSAALLAPPALRGLVDHLGAHARVGTAPAGLPLRLVLTGGRNLPRALAERTRRLLGDVLRVWYGSTETGLNTLTDPGELVRAPATAGRPFPGHRVAVLGEDLRPVPAGVYGRVAVGGYMLADGYADVPAPTLDLAGERLWLTGDIGRLDRAGRVYLAARDAAAGLPAVDVAGLQDDLAAAFGLADVAVLTDTDPAGAAVPGATVPTGAGLGAADLTVAFVPAPRSPVDPAAVAADAARRAGVELARAVQVDAIPYGPTGAVRARALRTLLATRPGAALAVNLAAPA